MRAPSSAPPRAPELIGHALEAFETGILPLLEGPGHEQAEIIARALRIAARDLAQAGIREAATAELAAIAARSLAGEQVSVRTLCRAIREGRFDSNTEMHHALWALCVIEASVTTPSALSRIECRIAGLPEETSTDRAF